MSGSILMQHPSGDLVVKPATNRETYEAKGFKYLGGAPDPGVEVVPRTQPKAPTNKRP